MVVIETVKHNYSIRPCTDGSGDDEVLIDSKVLGKIIAHTPYDVGVRVVFTYAVGPNPDLDWEIHVTAIVTGVR